MSEGLGPSAIDDIVAGYKLAAAVHAMVELGVPSALADDALSAEELGQRLDLDADRLDTLLRLLASRGVLIFAGARYRNSELSSSLRAREAEEMLLGWRMLPAVVAAWGGLAAAVRDGRSPFEVVHGVDLHAYFATHPADRARYDHAMASTVENFQQVADVIDMTGKSTLVCIGGASGLELVPILNGWPRLRAILVDLPGALDAASATLAEHGLADRVTIVAGDARREVPQGDAYLLTSVLRCLDDADAVAMLSACAASAGDTGTMLIVEMPIPDGPPQHPSATTDATAWVAYGGADRTLAHWSALHTAAGWRNLRTTPLDEPWELLTIERA